MTPWNLSETHDFVLDRFGGKQVLLVRECTRSIVDRQNFGRFHYHEMLRLATSFEENYLSETSLMEMHASDETVEAFQRFIIKVGAHATACVQCVHAIPDILANAIYYACGLNPESVFPQVHTFPSSLAAYILSKPAHYLTS